MDIIKSIKMRKYLKKFAKEFNYQDGIKSAVLNCYSDIIKKDKEGKFFDFLQAYNDNINCGVNKLIVDARNYFSEMGIEKFSVALVLIICLSKQLKKYYKKKNMSMEIWHRCMDDIYYKANECYCTYNIWGITEDFWYKGFFNCERVAFYNLQFEKIKSPIEYKSDKVNINIDDIVINVHLPSTGKKLDREGQKQAYRMASEYYKHCFSDKPVIFYCASWLLYPPMENMLPANSNLAKFRSDYDIISETKYDSDKLVLWRLFKNNETDLNKLEIKTSLQKNYVEFLRKGNKSGYGTGIYIYE